MATYMHISYFSGLLAVLFQSVEEASESRIQARRDWTKRTRLGETGGEARGKGTTLSSVTETFTSRLFSSAPRLALLSLARLIADRVFAHPLDYIQRETASSVLLLLCVL